MIIINIDKVIAEAEHERTHVPKIRIISTDIIEEAKEAISHEVDELVENAVDIEQKAANQHASLQQSLIWDLDNQFRDLRVHRAKQSNKYMPMIANGASQSELAAHYVMIESISADMRELYDKKEYVEKHGRLPEQGSAGATIESGNILALKETRRSLINRRNKLKKNITLAMAKGSTKLPELQLKSDQLDAEYLTVRDRITELSHE